MRTKLGSRAAALLEQIKSSNDEKQQDPIPAINDVEGESDITAKIISNDAKVFEKPNHVSNIHISVPVWTDDRSPQPHFSVSSRYRSASSDIFQKRPSEENTNSFNFDFTMGLNSTPSAVPDSSEPYKYHLPSLEYVVAAVIALGCLLIQIIFCTKYRVLRSKIEELEEIFTKQEEESVSSIDDLEEVLKEKQDALDEKAEIFSKWSADKIFYFLKQLAEDVDDTEKYDDKINYLTDDFLQEISKYIATQDSLRRNLDVLTPAALLRLGKFYHRHFSRHQGSAEEKDVKVNVGVYVNGIGTAEEKN